MPVGTEDDARIGDHHPVLAGRLGELLIQARAAQTRWSTVTIRERLHLIRQFRELLAIGAASLCDSIARVQSRPQSEILTAEIFPLIAACKFLERKAASLLAPQRLGTNGLPLWLHGVETVVSRDPYGVILIIGPVNYSLSLPGIQILQAVVSGNAVLFKPGSGGTHSAIALRQLLQVAGFDLGLVSLLPESIEASSAAVACGVDRVVFTGSAAVGAKILADLAPQLVPATMELSGCDALLVREDANLDLVKKSLHFSLSLNSGATCIAPHRLFVAQSRADELEGLLRRHFRSQPRRKLATPVADRLLPALKDALARGARFISGAIEPDGSIVAPVILTEVSPDCRLLRLDIFAPLIAMLRVKNDAEAIRRINDCPYALGASIFGENESQARAIAARLRVGFVTINDLIVPAGDPRVPIGGRRRSGFGSTRGREGLLDLTVPKVVAVRRGRFRPHFDVPSQENVELLHAYLQLSCARGVRRRWRALTFLVRRFFKGGFVRGGS